MVSNENEKIKSSISNTAFSDPFGGLLGVYQMFLVKDHIINTSRFSVQAVSTHISVLPLQI